MATHFGQLNLKHHTQTHWLKGIIDKLYRKYVDSWMTTETHCNYVHMESVTTSKSMEWFHMGNHKFLLMDIYHVTGQMSVS